MARDRIWYWSGSAPSVADIGLFLRNFFGAGAIIKEPLPLDPRRYYIDLPGDYSYPYAGLAHRLSFNDEVKRAYVATLRGQRRWIEVYIDSDHLDVITREADTYTNTLADGLFTAAKQMGPGREG